MAYLSRAGGKRLLITRQSELGAMLHFCDSGRGGA
jgi:hypothetical protein